MTSEHKTIDGIVTIPLFASIENKGAFLHELQEMAGIFGDACMVVWDDLDCGNDVLVANKHGDRIVDVYADSKKIKDATRRLHEDGELSRYMTLFADKLGLLCGYFEDTPLAMRMAPLHDILSTCVINEVSMRIDGDIYNNELMTDFNDERRASKAQFLAWEVVRTIFDSGAPEYDYDSDTLTEPEEWNFRYMFNKAYVQAMKDKGMRVLDSTEARVPMV